MDYQKKNLAAFIKEQIDEKIKNLALELKTHAGKFLKELHRCEPLISEKICELRLEEIDNMNAPILQKPSGML